MTDRLLPAPTGLRINLLAHPTCVRTDALRFSFLPGCRMTACRIAVAEGISNARTGRFLYDSGRLETTDSTGICAPGLSERLTEGHLYYVRISVCNEAGEESPLSEPLPFSAGIDWLYRSYLWPAKGERGELPDFAFFHYDFYLDEDDMSSIDRVYLSATARSPEPTRQYVYDLSLNREEVGVGPCRYGKMPTGETTVRFATYDVTDLLRVGTNVLSAVCYTTAEHGFLCQLTAFDKDGVPHVITNSGFDRTEWVVRGGDDVFGKSNSIGTSYFTAHACNIDATRYPPGFDSEKRWDEEEDEFSAWYHDNWGWGELVPVGDDLVLVPDETEPVRRYPTATPATVTSLPDGATLIDLGAEIVGGLRLTLDDPIDAPVRITLDYAEQLSPDRTTVKSPMNTGNRYRETWTLRPGKQTLETLSLMTYRYVRVEGLPAPVTPADICGMELRKGFSETDARLVTDHELLADLWQLTRHTVRVTTQDIYVDSQSRERGAYEGDLYINMLAAYAHEATFAPARLTTDYLLGHRTWPADYLLCIIYAARADYMATGDDRLLSAWYDTLKANLFTEWMDGSGLIKAPPIAASSRNAILVDWPPSERDGYDMGAAYNTVLNALHVQAYADMALIADVLGKTDDAAGFRRLHDDLRATVIDRLWDADAGRFRDGLGEDGTPSPHMAQHATAYALWAGIYTDDGMAQRMAESIAADGKLHVSVYAAFFLLEGLYRAGRGDIANRLMLDPDISDGARTWAYMLRRMEATVTTEAWNETNKPNMTLSHPWGAAPAHMIARGICGITPTAAGFASVDIRPALDGIDDLDATIPTLRGGIRVEWRAEEDSTHTLTVTLPPNVTARVYLPGRTPADEHAEATVYGTRTWRGL